MCIYTVKRQKILKNLKFLNFFCTLKISLKVLFLILKKKIFFNFFFILNILENNFYMVKRELPAEKNTIFYLYVT